MNEAPEREEQAVPDLVVIGASAGGVEALSAIAEGLPSDLDAAVLVVVHRPAESTSALADILDRAGPLPAAQAADGDRLRRGRIVIAPPDRHLVVDDGLVRVSRGPKVNGYRPSVDVLFHSAASSHGRNVTGVVLSGALNDGALGLRDVKRRGGSAIVQADALHQGMPDSAIASAAVDAVVPLRDIPETLSALLRSRKEKASKEMTESELDARFEISRLSDRGPSLFTCPECGGALWELEDGDAQGYVCHVGHSFSADSMLLEQGDAVERALWGCVRLLHERSVLLRRMAERMHARQSERSARRLEDKAREADEYAAVITRLLDEPLRLEAVVGSDPAEAPDERGAGV